MCVCVCVLVASQSQFPTGWQVAPAFGCLLWPLDACMNLLLELLQHQGFSHSDHVLLCGHEYCARALRPCSRVGTIVCPQDRARRAPARWPACPAGRPSLPMALGPRASCARRRCACGLPLSVIRMPAAHVCQNGGNVANDQSSSDHRVVPLADPAPPSSPEKVGQH